MSPGIGLIYEIKNNIYSKASKLKFKDTSFRGKNVCSQYRRSVRSLCGLTGKSIRLTLLRGSRCKLSFVLFFLMVV